MSIIRNSEVVRYSGVSNVLIVYNISWYIACCPLNETVRYWECPLIEVLLYIVLKVIYVQLPPFVAHR